MSKRADTAPAWIKNLSPEATMIAFGLVAGAVVGAADLAYTAYQKTQCPKGTTPIVTTTNGINSGLPVFNKKVECVSPSR